MRLHLLIVLAAFALPGCDSSRDRPPPKPTDALGAKAFKDGLIAYKQEKYAEAAQLFDTARKNLDDPSEAEADFREAQRALADTTAVADANRAFEKGQPREALALLGKVDASSHAFAAVEKLRQKIESAEKAGTPQAAVPPGGGAPDRKAAEAAYREGFMANAKADWTLCIELMRKATHLDPSFGLAHRGLGICYAKISEDKKAYCAYKRYLEVAPASPEAEQLRGWMKDMERGGTIDCPRS
jgi:tetratricopeptide (TPR) repeat protein